jgi:hypothetical protein
MAEARRASRSKTIGLLREPAKVAKLAEPVAIAHAAAAPKSSSSPSLSAIPQSSLLVGYFDLGVCAVSTAVEGQSILAEYWLRLPAVSMALRGQLALNAVAVAIYTRSNTRKACLN